MVGLNRNLTPIQTCAVVALLCGIWNIFGDIYFMDFSIAYKVSFDGTFGAIDEMKSGNLFDFNQKWPLLLSQAGGWMYPVWAMVTIYPLYLGLEPSGFRCSVLPCVLLAYGICIVGGNLHSGFAFATILPQVIYNQSIQSDDDDVLNELYSTITSAQTEVMNCYVFGYTPGPLAVFVASGWIMYVVLAKQTKFPRWFALCTPPVTLVWVLLVALLLFPLHSQLGFYVAGTFGTWIILVMNAAASWVLWNLDTQIILQKVEGPYHQID